MVGPRVYHLKHARSYAAFSANDTSKILDLALDWLKRHDFNTRRKGRNIARGSKRGIHVNFVPKFELCVEQGVNGQYVVRFDYYAKIKLGTGIVVGILTSGISTVVGVGTLAVTLADADHFVDKFWNHIDSLARGKAIIITQERWAQDAKGNFVQQPAIPVVAAAPPQQGHQTTHNTNNYYHNGPPPMQGAYGAPPPMQGAYGAPPPMHGAHPYPPPSHVVHAVPVQPMHNHIIQPMHPGHPSTNMYPAQPPYNNAPHHGQSYNNTPHPGQSYNNAPHPGQSYNNAPHPGQSYNTPQQSYNNAPHPGQSYNSSPHLGQPYNSTLPPPPPTAQLHYPPMPQQQAPPNIQPGQVFGHNTLRSTTSLASAPPVELPPHPPVHSQPPANSNGFPPSASLNSYAPPPLPAKSASLSNIGNNKSTPTPLSDTNNAQPPASRPQLPIATSANRPVPTTISSSLPPAPSVIGGAGGSQIGSGYPSPPSHVGSTSAYNPSYPPPPAPLHATPANHNYYPQAPSVVGSVASNNHHNNSSNNNNNKLYPDAASNASVQTTVKNLSNLNINNNNKDNRLSQYDMQSFHGGEAYNTTYQDFNYAPPAQNELKKSNETISPWDSVSIAANRRETLGLDKAGTNELYPQLTKPTGSSKQ